MEDDFWKLIAMLMIFSVIPIIIMEIQRRLDDR